MTGKTHQVLGLVAASATYFALHSPTPLTWTIAGTVITGAFFGSLFPDIDQPSSNFWESIPLGNLGRIIVPKTLGGHRNLSHSLLGIFLAFLLIQAASSFLLSSNIPHQILIESFMAGFLAHLAADSITVLGIPLFWPFGNQLGFPPHPFQGARIVTGKWFENFVVFPLSLLALGYILLLNQSSLCGVISAYCH